MQDTEKDVTQTMQTLSRAAKRKFAGGWRALSRAHRGYLALPFDAWTNWLFLEKTSIWTSSYNISQGEGPARKEACEGERLRVTRSHGPLCEVRPPS